MSLVVISVFLLLSCAAQHAWSLHSEHDAVLERQQWTQRRHLLSTLDNGGGNTFLKKDKTSAATYRIQRDWLTQNEGEEAIPHPELYYQDLDSGERQLIWAFDDTLPRDILAGRPDVWLQVTFQVEKDADLLFPFLEHYSRLGIALERMIFTLVALKLHNKELLQVQKALRQVGAVHRTLLLEEKISSFCTNTQFRKAVFEANLRAMYSVPIKDWIIAVEGNELIQFQLPKSGTDNDSNGNGGNGLRGEKKGEETDYVAVSAQEFFETLELRGFNWVAGLPIERLSSSGSFEKLNTPSFFKNGGSGGGSWSGHLALQFPLKCHFSSNFPAENRTKVVAYRGYLRPDATRRTIIAAETAKSYFTSLVLQEEDNNAATRDANSLYDLTPYSRYWEFYKTALMVGNAYLWAERRPEYGNDAAAAPAAAGGATLHRFRWHSGSTTQLNFEKDSEDAFCEEDIDDKVERHDAMAFSRLVKAGKVENLHGGSDGTTNNVNIWCGEETTGEVSQFLPLRKESALSLAALRRMYINSNEYIVLI